MLGAHRLFDLPSQHLFHCGGGRCFKDAFLFQKVFKRGASIGIFRHCFHTPSHSLTGSVPEAVLKNLAGRIFSESFIHMLYHIWYNMSSSMLHMNVTIELYWLHGTSVQKKPLLSRVERA